MAADIAITNVFIECMKNECFLTIDDFGKVTT